MINGQQQKIVNGFMIITDVQSNKVLKRGVTSLFHNFPQWSRNKNILILTGFSFLFPISQTTGRSKSSCSLTRAF